MGKIIPRGKLGTVAKYMTRTQAVKKLQLRLAEFRRLCILKGVHPREPKKKFKGQNKTYYHVKDINFLAHEPLLESFRRISAHEKKVRKARARRNHELAKQLARRAPTYKLDHLVRERYPTFLDALRDVDDALCMVHLFATLPADGGQAIPAAAVATSRRIVLEWQAFCVRTSAIRKAFISVKGYYFQAEVKGQTVTWLAPHALAQVVPKDVDFRVMLTFLEFYHTLLQFTLFKLYHDLGLRYPPAVRPEADRAAAELAVIMREVGGVQEGEAARRSAAAAALSDADAVQHAEALADDFRAQAVPGADALQTSDASAATASHEGGADDVSSASDAEGGAGSSGDEGASDAELEIDSGGSDSDSAGPDAPAAAEAEAAERSAPAEARPEADAGAAAAGGALLVHGGEAVVCASLFSGAVVWLAREVPREVLMLIIRSFGGAVCWDGPGSPREESDEAITHAIVDRPSQAHTRLGRAYVQPQWAFDCANFRVLIPTAAYAPGRKPPPHLSPFADYAAEGYVPEYAATLQGLQQASEAARARAAGAPLEGGLAAFEATQAAAAEDVEGAAAREAAAREAAREERHQAELAVELGRAVNAAAPAKRKLEAVDDALVDSQKKALMTRKQRKMYEGLRRKEAEKEARVAELERKRAAAAGPAS